MKQVKGDIIALMTPEGIVMYPWVFEKNPEPDDAGKTWYGCMLKFPKDTVDQEELKEMRRAFMKAARQGWPEGNDGDGGFTSDFGSPLRDGDKFDKANNKKRKEELLGHWYINFKSDGKPGVVMVTDGPLRDVLSREDFYPGCKAVISGVAFPYENKGNEGVGVRLTNVCKTGDGERIGGKPAAKEQFSKFSKNAPKKNNADADDLL